MAAGLDFKLSGGALGAPPSPPLRQRVQGLVPETSEGLQEVLWKQLFADPPQWWSHNPRHNKSHTALWLDKRHSPAWEDSQLAGWDAGRQAAPDSASTSGAWGGRHFAASHEGFLEVGMCRKLCEDGRVSEAVDALSLLVQRGRYVDQNLFYRVLKWCISHKDLALGRRVHALSVEGGYEGNAFLATHLIGLYAAHGILEEAMRVFTKVSSPDAYNWATIIFAHARRGEVTEAIRLYRLMRESSTLSPDGRIYSAVLKACAAAGDLVAGKEVHAHILAGPEKPDVFVQTGLVDMYAKCRSLEDARRVFDGLTDRTVVVWTAMISGYAQQGMGEEALSLYRSMQQEDLAPPDLVTYVCLLQACAGVGAGALQEGKQLHAQIRERGLQEDGVLGSSLVSMYAKCGSLKDARRVFDRLPARNVVAWNAILGGYAQQGMGQEALTLYRRMQQEGGQIRADSVTYTALLQACASLGVAALLKGKQLHAEIVENDLQGDVVLACSLVNMYVKCGSLEDARSLFDVLPDRNIVTWTAMIAGYAREGMGQEALNLYRSMKEEGLSPPDSVTYVCLLQACANVGVGALYEGKQLHAQITEQGLQEDVVLGGSLVNMYAKCGSLEDARRVFDRLPARNVFTWTSMIAGYVQQGMGEEAIGIYRRMQREGLTHPNSVTYACLLLACATVGVGALHEGKQLHAQIKERGVQEDLVLGGSLVNMYAKCGSLEDARSVFDTLPARNVVVWNALLAGYAQRGMGEEALDLYKNMQQEGLSPDSVTYVCLLQACAAVGVGALHDAKQLHAEIKERGLQEDVVLGGSLVNMYAKCGSLEAARSVFDILPARNVVAWNAILAGYAQQGKGEEALSLYRKMQREGLSPVNSVTYVCVLQACASVGVDALQEGQQLHTEIKERGLHEDVVLSGSLVNMYAKCGSLEDARMLFDRLPARNVVTWTAIIAGYAQEGMGEEALSLYRSMQQEGISPPDSITYVCLLRACGAVAALPLGKQLHAEIEERGLLADVVVGAALVNMYATCGSMSDSQEVFESLPERSLQAWSALISGYAHQGDSDVVFDLLARMRLEGIQPDGITFLSVLTVCSHVGLVDKGKEYFEAMRAEYGISATVEHFACMMDLLGRAGHLEDALQMAKTMPFPPNSSVWHTLLAGCQKWKNVEIGEQAFQAAVTLDEKDAASYVMMSNIYASVQMWDDANEMQERRKKLGAWKKQGQSWWTDMGGEVHTFVVGDKKRPENEGMHARLEQLVPEVKEGHVPHQHS